MGGLYLIHCEYSGENWLCYLQLACMWVCKWWVQYIFHRNVSVSLLQKYLCLRLYSRDKLLMVRSHQVLRLCDQMLRWTYPSEIWQGTQQHCCWACQNAQPFDKSKAFSHGYVISWCCIIYFLKALGWGLLSQIPVLSKQMLGIEYQIYIWQVSLQLSCSDTCQIWMWFKESNMYFCHIENFAYVIMEQLTNRALVTPTPGVLPPLYRVSAV